MSSPYCVPEKSYQQLIDKLQSAVPKSMSMIGSLRNVLRGRLAANFYVDKWPDFTAVVCQYIWPRRSDVADIGAYATSSEALLSVLTKGNLVTWGKRQEFQRKELVFPPPIWLVSYVCSHAGIEDKHADYLLTHLKPSGSNDGGLKCIHERGAFYYEELTVEGFNVCSGHRILNETLDRISKLTPDGFILGKLHPHHAKMVSSQWPRLKDWPNKEPYFRQLIKNYPCPAIYSVDNLDEPVSYMVRFPCNQSFAFTHRNYRGRKLTNLTTLCSAKDMIVIENVLPVETEISHRGRILTEKEFGAVDAGYSVKDLVTMSDMRAKL